MNSETGKCGSREKRINPGDNVHLFSVKKKCLFRSDVSPSFAMRNSFITVSCGPGRGGRGDVHWEYGPMLQSSRAPIS